MLVMSFREATSRGARSWAWRTPGSRAPRSLVASCGADLLGPVRPVGHQREGARAVGELESAAAHQRVGAEAVGVDAADAAGPVGIIAVGIGLGGGQQRCLISSCARKVGFGPSVVTSVAWSGAGKGW